MLIKSAIVLLALVIGVAAGMTEIELKPCQNVTSFELKPKTMEQD